MYDLPKLSKSLFRKTTMKIWKSKKNGMWHFTLQSGNGKKVIQSEGYKTRAKCIDTASNISNMAYWAKFVIEEVDKTPKPKKKK